MKQESTLVLQRELEGKEHLLSNVGDDDAAPSDAALGALLEDGEPAVDAEGRVRRLGERVARLDALNVAGMLAAASEGGGAGARLAARLDAGLRAGAALAERRARCDAILRAAPDAAHARFGAARTDANARALLRELEELYAWLDAPPLRDLDSLAEVSLASEEGRARALAAAEALRAALRAEASAPAARRRLGAARERLRRLGRARDQLAVALARHLNNALIHLGNEAAGEARTRRHHAELPPYAPFMRWLKVMDARAFEALAGVYVGSWARAYEREVRAACEAARHALAAAPPDRADALLDNVLTLVEGICDAEQDFCTQFFYLDVDVKSEGSDGERSERSEGGAGRGEGGAGRGAGAETRRFMGELFPTLEAELVALVGAVERTDKYGAMRALACVGRRVLGAEGAVGGAASGAPSGPVSVAGSGTASVAGSGAVSVAGSGSGAAGGEARWARAALAAAAVAAKRAADKAISERIALFPECVKQAARRPKCGLLGFLRELEELSAAGELIFRGGRRADLDRWYLTLASAALQQLAHASHPRTPRAVLQCENYHRLHGVLSALRVGALEGVRRECRARYADALRAYVTHYFGRPLEKLTQFFESVSEAVAAGVRADEVCYRAALSKHELKRILALYPAHEVRKSLHRLYRTVEKHFSEEGGLLQVVWRAMQEEFLAQHVALQARIAACYPGAGLHMPLTTQDILDAFSDIAREH